MILVAEAGTVPPSVIVLGAIGSFLAVIIAAVTGYLTTRSKAKVDGAGMSLATAEFGQAGLKLLIDEQRQQIVELRAEMKAQEAQCKADIATLQKEVDRLKRGPRDR